jgi:hypothetical protein
MSRTHVLTEPLSQPFFSHHSPATISRRTDVVPVVDRFNSPSHSSPAPHDAKNFPEPVPLPLSCRSGEPFSRAGTRKPRSGMPYSSSGTPLSRAGKPEARLNLEDDKLVLQNGGTIPEEGQTGSTGDGSLASHGNLPGFRLGRGRNHASRRCPKVGDPSACFSSCRGRGGGLGGARFGPVHRVVMGAGNGVRQNSDQRFTSLAPASVRLRSLNRAPKAPSSRSWASRRLLGREARR